MVKRVKLFAAERQQVKTLSEFGNKRFDLEQIGFQYWSAQLRLTIDGLKQ